MQTCVQSDGSKAEILSAIHAFGVVSYTWETVYRNYLLYYLPLSKPSKGALQTAIQTIGTREELACPHLSET